MLACQRAFAIITAVTTVTMALHIVESLIFDTFRKEPHAHAL